MGSKLKKDMFFLLKENWFALTEFVVFLDISIRYINIAKKTDDLQRNEWVGLINTCYIICCQTFLNIHVMNYCAINLRKALVNKKCKHVLTIA